MKTRGNRHDWLDCAKGLGIILVVIGHAVAGPMQDWIYLFHMPLFFMLAGVTFRPDPAGVLLAKRARTLLLPYMSFLILLLVIQDATMLMQRRVWGEVLHADLKFMTGFLLGGRWLTGGFGTAWFMTALFGAVMLYGFLRRGIGSPRDWRFIPVVILLLIAGHAFGRYSWPWDAAVIPMATVFLWAGELWAMTVLADGEPQVRRHRPANLAVLLAAIAITPFALPMDMKFGVYGTPVLSVLAAILWTHVIVIAGMALSHERFRRIGLTRALATVGQASLVILFIHRIALIEMEGGLPVTVRVLLALGVSMLCYACLRKSPPLVRTAFLGHPFPAGSGAPFWTRHLPAEWTAGQTGVKRPKE